MTRALGKSSGLARGPGEAGVCGPRGRRKTLFLVLAAIAAVTVLVSAVASADTSAPKFGTGTNVFVTGADVEWTNPANIGADDDAYATCTDIPVSGGTSYQLLAKDFQFAIPSRATIDGIEVTIGRGSSGANLRDSVVQLTKNGSALVGSNKGATSTDWPTSEGVAVYGGSTDKWDTTWTAADVNSANFGVALQAVNVDTGVVRTASVDYISVTIHYTPLTSPVQVTVTVTAQSKTYDGNRTAVVTLQSEQLEPTDNVTIGYSTATFDSKDVGAGKAVTVSGLALTGDDAGNYALTQPSGLAASIVPATLRITAADQTKLYWRTFTFTGSEFTTAGLARGEAIDTVTLASDGADAAATPGTYPITASDAQPAAGTDLDNYEVEYVNGTMTVVGGMKVGAFAKPLRLGDPRRFRRGATIRVVFVVRDHAGKLVRNAVPKVTVTRDGRTVYGPKTVKYNTTLKKYELRLKTRATWKLGAYKLTVTLGPGNTGRTVWFRLIR